ncbi:hypothetical protein [Paracoccus binzhouensis]|uniref:hypothetical protein n=1 Tax=Paracoccus binzhouensis TaxID=2796149 RepID=UPI0018EEDB64|nr:hypothetical protein [Paracoccus binzhouensis]
MIPVANQIQSLAGPAAAPAARTAEAPLVAQAPPRLPPVEETAPASEDVRLGRDGIGQARQAGTGGRKLQAPVRPAAGDADSPQDRAVFRARVIKFLTAIYGDDEAFLRALRRGTIVVRAVEDQPEPEMRPELTYAIYREGVAQAQQFAPDLARRRRSGGPPVSVGPHDFIAWWPK